METIFIDLKRNRLLNIFLSTSIVFLLEGCISLKNVQTAKDGVVGVYILKSDLLYQALTDMNYHSLILNKDGTYILNKALIKFTPVIEQCEIASKGKWSILSNDVLELTSEDKYLKQKGFEYEIKKENKLSQDSLYIRVNFPDDFQSFFKLRFSFNYQEEIFLEPGKTFIALPKSKYLWSKTTNSVNKNHISFSLNANISGIELYKSRILFEVFEENIDTEKTNYLTITLPNFDLCFLQFEPYKQELIFIKNESKLIWQGKSWEKMY